MEVEEGQGDLGRGGEGRVRRRVGGGREEGGGREREGGRGKGKTEERKREGGGSKDTITLNVECKNLHI